MNNNNIMINNNMINNNNNMINNNKNMINNNNNNNMMNNNLMKINNMMNNINLNNNFNNMINKNIINNNRNLIEKRSELFSDNKFVPIKITNLVLKCVCKINIKRNGGNTFGTGFFMKMNNSSKYLITNYHMLYQKIQQMKILKSKFIMVKE